MTEDRRHLDWRLEDHYEREEREEERLTRGHGRLEFLRTLEILNRYLPPPPSVIYDVGGGTGVYALPLADQGYEVHLLEPVKRHLLLAREASRRADAPLASVEWGNARELPWEEDSGDTVLLLGPLYHLTERDERLQALRETYRVLHPGGLAVVAAISRFASTCDGLVGGFLDDEYFEKIVERDVREGQHRNPSRRPGWFTTAYFHLPIELAAEISEAGFKDVEVLAVEGPGWLVPDLQERLDDPERLDRLLRVIERVEREPSLLGASAHLLAIGRRP